MCDINFVSFWVLFQKNEPESILTSFFFTKSSKVFQLLVWRDGMVLSFVFHNAFFVWNCLNIFRQNKKKIYWQKKKLKQIILNKIHFLILKNDFCFEFFTKINHYNTFHCTGLTFWKLSRTIELYICLTPGVCMITIEHDGLFLTLRRTLWFFSYICTKKKKTWEKKSGKTI